jgi:F0F1-type ATP synthase assembly protein I
MNDPDPLEKLAAKADEINAPKLDEEFEARMADKVSELEGKVKVARARHASEAEKNSKIIEDSGQSYRGLGVGLSIAYAIIGLPLVGYGIGYLLDMGKPPLWQGLFTVAGAAGGVWFAVFQMNRTNPK